MDTSKSFARRDKLLEIESKVTQWWDESDVFKAESKPIAPKPGEKFFGNFPYPYMNGYLHLGHAFSLSKLEFAAGYHRLRGANVLLPFAFHCTGMPIKASADKIRREMERFGNPPCFPMNVEEKEVEVEEEKVQTLPDKFKSKKSKAASKTGKQLYQWEIMQSYGLSDGEIEPFQNPEHWLTYFPPLAKEDLKAFGLGCDWRRSFITTDMNPFYDSFVKWQVRKLKDMGKIVKATRYAIYSPLDGQPCADHDRASGEGAQPQEYVLIKMEVLSPFPPKLAVLEGRKVFLAAATLRPETMPGQTNAWVLPDGKYGAYEINETDVFIVTERAALNLSYQNLSRIPEQPNCLLELTGKDIIGLPLRSPLAVNEVIYSLPMLTILTDKGTGIVTSVPSDSPDDYMALHDLKKKQGLREKYGVKDEWVLPFEVIPIINIPEFGDKAAEHVCLELKIQSQNDKEKLTEAKRMTYLKGFTEGVMLTGEYAGMRVQDAKPLIKKRLLETDEGVLYSEPEKKVMSRSGDECVVALTDQWYISYGEEEWRKMAEECLANMNLFCDETRNHFEHTLGWLNQWACSRSFGLGTRIPWDEQFLVESLSDSTLYMAYYTIAHLLQNGDMYGDDTSLLKPEQMTDEVWNYIFCDEAYPNSSDIPSSVLSKMKQEFDYWYPFDLRVSGKDLIQNHLTFCIYNHTALLEKRHWPRGFRCNGHIMLNSEKMSKSTGNFRTLRESIQEFSADATRFALADAGDGMDDANFVFETANAAILRLTKEIAWMEEVLAAESDLRTGPPSTYADRVFANEMNIAVTMAEKLYNEYMFREALKVGFYDLQAARDEYRFSCGSGGMNQGLVRRFMDVQTRLITPICPHYSEYVWRELLKNDGSLHLLQQFSFQTQFFKITLQTMAFSSISALFLVICFFHVCLAGRQLTQLVDDQSSGLLKYHKGPLLSGKININLIWYGKFKPSQRAIVSDFVQSLYPSKTQSTKISPSVSSWWKITEKYYSAKKHSAPLLFTMGKQILDEKYSVGKSLTSKQIVGLAAKGDQMNAINVVLTASDVVVDGFCSSRCGTHGSSSSKTAQVKGKNNKFAYIWVGNSEVQCPGQCAWPFHQPIYGPQSPPLVAPNNDVGLDGMVINLASLLAGTATNPFGNGYFQGEAEAPLEAASACPGVYGKGAYPGYAGDLLVDSTTGASYNAHGANGRKYLLPALFDPSTSTCSTLV